MKPNIFAELWRTIEQTDRWLNDFPAGRNPLADKLKVYLRSCGRTPAKWRIESEARRTIRKIKNVTTVILLIEYRRGPDR